MPQTWKTDCPFLFQHNFHVPDGHCLLAVHAFLGSPAFPTQPLKICLPFKKTVSHLFVSGPAFQGLTKILGEVSAEFLLLSLQQHCTSQSLCSFRGVFSNIIHRWPRYMECATGLVRRNGRTSAFVQVLQTPRGKGLHLPAFGPSSWSLVDPLLLTRPELCGKQRDKSAV